MTRDDRRGISELNSTHSGLPLTFTIAFLSVFHRPCEAIILVIAPLINSTAIILVNAPLIQWRADCLVVNFLKLSCNVNCSQDGVIVVKFLREWISTRCLAVI